MKTFFTTHPIMKTLSILIAFALWFVVHGEQQIESSVNVNVETRNVPKDLVIAGEVEPKINLRIAGPRTRISSITEKTFRPYVLDLSGLKEGVASFRVYEQSFNHPRGTRITRIAPQIIRVNLEKAENRLVRVEPRFVGELEEGFQLVRQEILPRYVNVRGPRRELDRLTALYTEPISLSGRRESFEGVFALRGLGFGWTLDHEDVTVTIGIQEQEVSKILEGVPVIVAGTNQNVKIVPNKVTLKAKGPASKIISFLGEEIAVEIDFRQVDIARKGRKNVQIRPIPPRHPGIEITMIPDNVRLTVLGEK